MAKRKQAGAVNPVSEKDPRFDPANDAENAAAHESEVEDAESLKDDSPIQDAVTRMLERAVQFYEEELEPAQSEATKYYKGDPFGDEQDGRSKVVATVLRDKVEAVLPSLMRIFAGTERPVEFAPDSAEDVSVAEQMTEYVNHIVMEQNDGFLVTYSAFKDALVRRMGIVKWWPEEFCRVKQNKLSGVSLEGMAQLVEDPEVEIDTLEPQEDGTFNVTVTRKSYDKKFKIAAVPNEEFVFTPDARSIEDAPIVAHIQELPIDYVVGLVGEEHREFVELQAGKERGMSSEDLQNARSFSNQTSLPEDDDGRDETQKTVIYAEAYVLIDGDDDGTAERRLCQCVGPQYKILNNDGMGEIVDDVPFAIFTPIPEPHTIVGQSFYDLLKDLQRIESQVWRGTLDSLALAIEPKTEVVTGEVNMGDLLNPEVNNIIRVRRPGMMREIKHSFVGPDTLPVLATLQDMESDRTGQTKASEGLDADVLQSTTKSAVSATMTKAQQRTEMIARIFAETGMKRLYRGLLKMVTQHQQRSKIVRMRGQYVEVDPRSWDAEKDVTINVALGAGLVEEKLAALQTIAQDHAQLAQMGSPLVGNVEARKLRAKFTELLGFKDVDSFYKPWTEQEEMQMQQALAQQQPPPSPEMALVQVEQMKAQAKIQADMQKMELDRQKAEAEHALKREEMMLEHDLKMQEMQQRFALEMRIAEEKLNLDREKAQTEAEIKRETAAANQQPREVRVRQVRETN